jgi:hypothetical protein
MRRLQKMMMYLGMYSNCWELINNIHETEEWPKDFTEVTMIA